MESDWNIGASLVRAIRHADISVYCQDQGLTVLWAQNIPDFWASGRRIVGLKDADIFAPAVAERLADTKQRVMSTRKSEVCEIAVEGPEGARWYDVWVDPGVGNSEVLTTAVETTEHKRREQTLKALLREVSHRSKNLLAIIQSIASQTGRYSKTIDVFLARFRGRLQSLAASQDLVTQSNWRGADLHELVTNQVSRYAADPRNSVRVSGVNPYLNPNAALHVGLALHELAVNSVSFGALSHPEGFIQISATYDTDAAGHKALRLEWLEAVASPAQEAPEKRFGSVALERVVPASLKGQAQLDIGSKLLRYTLTVPAGAAGVE